MDKLNTFKLCTNNILPDECLEIIEKYYKQKIRKKCIVCSYGNRQYYDYISTLGYTCSNFCYLNI